LTTASARPSHGSSSSSSRGHQPARERVADKARRERADGDPGEEIVDERRQAQLFARKPPQSARIRLITMVAMSEVSCGMSARGEIDRIAW
jgi:hypothetical protein